MDESAEEREDPVEERIFTREEANGLLPELDGLLREIQSARRMITRLQPEIKKAGTHLAANGGSPVGPHYVRALKTVIDHIERIQGMGVLLRDLDRGLCDFPFMLNGRLVYLCWKLGESEIEWWHETHTGYSGRRPLE